jgi:mRNA interferase YafQ
MRRILYSTPFKRDFKRLQKRGKDMDRLRAVISRLAAGQVLSDKHRDHALQGKYAGARDCHVEPDWVLIYAVVGEELRLIRTGSHTDLFE